MAKPKQDRTGQRRGKFLVLADSGGEMLHCRCDCGMESLRPRAMFKPSFRGLLACEYCLGHPCEVCGEILPRKNRQPAATCSPECRAERHRKIERERYSRKREDPEFAEALRRRREQLKIRMANDTAFAEHMRRMRNAITFSYRWRLKQDKDAYSAARIKARALNKEWRLKIRQDPEKELEWKIKRRMYYLLVWKPKHDPR